MPVPVNSETWKGAEAVEPLDDQLVEFLEKNKDQAYQIEEILSEVRGLDPIDSFDLDEVSLGTVIGRVTTYSEVRAEVFARLWSLHHEGEIEIRAADKELFDGEYRDEGGKPLFSYKSEE
jgi:hypothetical protein